MSSYVPFHTKLTSIMGVFVNAAVTQICELVDEGYAVLHLEISRSQKENADLKEKLLKIEMSNALRGLGSITPIQHERNVSQVSAMSAGMCHSQDKDCYSNKRPVQPEFDVCIEGDVSSTKGPSHSQHLPSTNNMQTNKVTVDQPMERLSILIKEEIEEEDLVLDVIEHMSGQRVTEEQSPIQIHQHVDHQPPEQNHEDFQTSLDKNTTPEPVSEDPVAVPYTPDINISPPYFTANPEKHMPVHDENNEDGLFPVHFDTDTEKPDVIVVDSEDFNRSSQPIESISLLEPDDVPSNSSYLDKGYAAETRRFTNTPRTHRDSRFGRKFTNPHRQLPTMADITGKGGNREKRYSCAFCGKSFTCPKYLQSHLRVHTGEKPFSCSQCGKRFGQAGYLKKHQNIHTGVKPYGCPLCGKRFADASNLIRHKSVHAAEKSFVCIHCGERFAVKHNLKFHIERHHPAFAGSQDEEVSVTLH